MKKILHAISLFSVVAFASMVIFTSHVSAQEWVTDDIWNDYTPTYNGNTDFVDVSCSWCTDSSVSSPSNPYWVDDTVWNNYTPTYNGNTDFVDVNCVGCGFTSDTSWINDSTWNDYTPTYNGNTDYVDVSCAYCNTYTPTYSSPSYVTPTYTSPSYVTPTYSTPSYVSPTYTTPTYVSPTYTTPTYTTPTYTTPTYTTPTYTTTRCADGSAPINGSCTRVTTIPVTTSTVCSDGFAPTNGSCVRTNTIPTTTSTRCSDGSTPNPVTGCTRTNVIPTNTTTICSDGSHPVNGSCTRVVTAPTVTYQTCWDGSVIPLTSSCPAQYKTCANGTSIPVTQTCYYGNTYVPYTPPVTVKFNNVITSVATEITTVSARCNGIGLIASNAQSTGWFEYGETANLGRETAKANIGSSATAPFSNLLTNLKPGTTYFCRAVMQNQYGVVKGEVVSFTTKAKAVVYVKPVTAVKTTTTKVKTAPATKVNEVICSDGSTVKVGSKSAAGLINSGEKLVSLQIEKVSGNLSAGSQVNYKLTLKNLSDETLNGLTVKVVIPQEVVLTNASTGNYDAVTHTLTVQYPSLAAYSEGSIMWSGTVSKDATVGRSLVTTAYTNYSVPGTDVQDEVTAYVVGSVSTGTDNASSTGAKKVVGATDSTDRGFLPDTLVEWLALIAIIFIIFILGRSVYSSYSDKKKATH